MEPQTFVFIGRSGCGKGTQVDLLREKLSVSGRNIFFYETGKVFRKFIDEGKSYTSELSRDVISNGRLMPAFLAINNWATGIIEGGEKEDHWIFDGICRRVDEAPIFAEAMKFYGREGNKVHVIYMNVTAEWATERLLGRARADDTRESIMNRQGWFDKNVLPAVEMLKTGTGFHFCDINGEQPIPDVHKEIMEKLSLPI